MWETEESKASRTKRGSEKLGPRGGGERSQEPRGAKGKSKATRVAVGLRWLVAGAGQGHFLVLNPHRKELAGTWLEAWTKSLGLMGREHGANLL